MAYFGLLDSGNPASSNYYKDPIAKMYERTNAVKQNYFRGLHDRAQSVKTLESAGMTSPEYQLKKYIWQMNEQMMPMYEQQQAVPQQQQMQPWQMYAQPMAPSTPATPQAGGGVLSGTVAPVSTMPQVMPNQATLSGTTQPEQTPQTAQPSYYSGGSYYQPQASHISLLSGGLW